MGSADGVCLIPPEEAIGLLPYNLQDSPAWGSKSSAPVGLSQLFPVPLAASHAGEPVHA